MSINLQAQPDTHDWRDDIPGLVRLPEDHVYGKTAIGVEKYAELIEQYRRQRYFVVYTTPNLGRRVPGPSVRWEVAMSDFRNGVKATAGKDTYHPHSGMRLSVISEQTLRQSITDGAKK